MSQEQKIQKRFGSKVTFFSRKGLSFFFSSNQRFVGSFCLQVQWTGDRVASCDRLRCHTNQMTLESFFQKNLGMTATVAKKDGCRSVERNISLLWDSSSSWSLIANLSDGISVVVFLFVVCYGCWTLDQHQRLMTSLDFIDLIGRGSPFGCLFVRCCFTSDLKVRCSCVTYCSREVERNSPRR